MVLSDRGIEQAVAAGEIKVSMVADWESQLQPASLDCRIGYKVVRFRRKYWLFGPEVEVKEEYKAGQTIWLAPGEFLLAHTVEVLTLGDTIVSRVEGRSSIGRKGILVHATAGFIDPGWTNGQITLEVKNITWFWRRLIVGGRVCQLSFQRLDQPARSPYGEERGSKYQGQMGAVPARKDLVL